MSDYCLICFDEATEMCPFMDPNPCNCKGSMKIHLHCYELVRTQSFDKVNTDNGLKMKCPVCHTLVNDEPALGQNFEMDSLGLTYTQYKVVQINRQKKKVKHGYMLTYIMMDGLKKLYAYELFNNGISGGKIDIVFPGKEKEINFKVTNINDIINQNEVLNN